MKIENYLEKSPVFSILELARLTQNKLKQELGEYDLSYYQALILVALHVEQNPTTQVKELVDSFPITKGAISQNISILESQKLVKRVSTNDKRMTLVKISSKGIGLAQELMGVFERSERSFEKILNKETQLELDQLKLQLRD